MEIFELLGALLEAAFSIGDILSAVIELSSGSDPHHRR